MPRVILGAKTKKEDQERRQNDVIALLVRINKGRNAVQDMELADQIHVERTSITRYKTPEGIGKADFAIVRRLFHAVGGTREEWLRAGGFEP